MIIAVGRNTGADQRGSDTAKEGIVQEVIFGFGLERTIQIREMKGHVRVKYTSPPLCVEDTFQDPQWMPETAENTMYMLLLFFSSTYISVIKFNL